MLKHFDVCIHLLHQMCCSHTYNYVEAAVQWLVEETVFESQGPDRHGPWVHSSSSKWITVLPSCSWTSPQEIQGQESDIALQQEMFHYHRVLKQLARYFTTATHPLKRKLQKVRENSHSRYLKKQDWLLDCATTEVLEKYQAVNSQEIRLFIRTIGLSNTPSTTASSSVSKEPYLKDWYWSLSSYSSLNLPAWRSVLQNMKISVSHLFSEAVLLISKMTYSSYFSHHFKALIHTET